MSSGHPPYTFSVRKASGLEFWYFRHRGLGKKTPPLPGQPGDPKFHREYAVLLAQATGEQKAAEERADNRSVRWLAEAYQSSDEWNELSDASRHDYSRELNRLCSLAGDLPFASMTKKGVLALRGEVKAEVVNARELACRKREEEDRVRASKGLKPNTKRGLPKVTDGSRTADYFVAVVSALYSWAIEHEELPPEFRNPATKTKKLRKKSKVEGYRVWTEEQIEQVLNHAPRPIRDGVVMGLYTGQRLADCIEARKADVIIPVIRVKQLKTGNPIEIRAIGPLLELLERRKDADDGCDRLLIREDGQPYTKRLFSEHLRKFLDGLDFSDISFHGLRYAAAGTLNEAGATVATIVSILGHSTHQMAMKYLQAREDQARAAALMALADERRSNGQDE